MTDPLGIGRPPGPGTPLIQAAATAPVAELLGPAPALPLATNFTATVVERSPEGTLLLRSAYGALTIKMPQPLAPGTRIELRLQPGTPPSLSLLAIGEPEAEEAHPPLQLDLGTTVTATVVTAAQGDDAEAVGARLLLRVVATASGAVGAGLSGTILVGAAGDTVIDSPLGLLALDRRLALPTGTRIVFERFGTAAPPEPVDLAPSPASGFRSLDQALMVLDKEAPLLAQQLRGTLSPDTAPALAGTLLFLIGALYRGKWPGDAVGRALSAAGQDRLRAKLGEDFAELGRLGKDEATGEWQVLTVPLMSGAAVEPLRLFLRRRGAAAETPGDGARFVLEAELSHFGAVQLDGMVRGSRLDLVLRSHAPLPPDLRAEAASVFRRASAAQGFQGDIVFATAATFTVAPLAGLRRPVELRI